MRATVSIRDDNTVLSTWTVTAAIRSCSDIALVTSQTEQKNVLGQMIRQVLVPSLDHIITFANITKKKKEMSR